MNLHNSLFALCTKASSVRSRTTRRATVASLKFYGYAALWVLAFCFAAEALPAQTVSPRITAQIENSQRSTIAGSRSPMARSANDVGSVPSSNQLHGMALVFSLTSAQQSDLQTLLAAQQNPSSSLYHQWLTPDQYAARFGVSDTDIASIQSWLEQQGFTIDRIARSKTRITFSGTVAQANAAFDTQLHSYKSGTTTHYAPSADISIPAALSSVVQSVSNLSSFRPSPRVRFRSQPAGTTANFTSSQTGSHFLTPKDISTIYNINAAYNAGYTGTGQSIAIVGQSSVVLSDIENFQNAAGLTVKDPTTVLVPSSGTSVTSTGDEAESDLDLEYSGAIAKGATIYFVYVGNNQNYSVWDSIQYAVDTKLAPIVSTSYGTCETELSSTDYATLNGILAQAASQGQTVVAASGDSGSTDCQADTALSTAQEEALAVDFPASSQYVTGMGGTEFSAANVSSSNTTYWTSANGSDVIGSALSYIPEQVWNDDSSTNGLSSGGGGTSTLSARPTWQTGVAGIPSGNYRLVPDLSLDSSPNNAGYLYCSSDSTTTGISGSCANGFRDSSSTNLTVAGGTSFAAPIFSGMLAIVNQKVGSTGQGVVNSTLYTLAANASTYASAFHDITSGGNQCTAGSTYCSSTGSSQYAATTGYDQASGLGSVDFFNLLTVWPATTAVSTSQSTTTTFSAATTSPASGAADLITINVASASTASTTQPTGTVTVAVDGTAVSPSLTLSNGSATYSFSSTTSGSHTVTATYSGDSTFSASTGTVILTIGSTTGTGSGGSASTTVAVTPSGGYTGTVDLSISTLSTYLQDYACYSVANATVTGTSSVSQALTIYTGSASCSSAQVKSGKVHAFLSTAKIAFSSSQPVLAAAFSILGLFLAALVGGRSRQLRNLCGCVALLSLGIGLFGCGSSTSSTSKGFSVSTSPSTLTVSAGTSGIPTGSYSLTVTGADSVSSSETASSAFTLTVD